MPKISVIVPVYNSEQFLKSAVDSILNQTFEDYEIILVNDASSDKSGLICEQLAQIDNRIIVQHLQTNSGICGARNAGLKLATGNYVSFCDDDDLYSPFLLEKSYMNAIKYNADFIKFGKRLIDIDMDNKVIRTKESKATKKIILKNKEIYENYFQLRSLSSFINVWNGLYSMKIIRDNNIEFNTSMKYGSEDADFSMRFFLHSNSIVFLPDILYTHFRRDTSSTSRKYNFNKIESLILAAHTENKIWSRLEKNDNNTYNIIFCKNKYIVSIISQQLLHKDCDLTFNQRIDVLRSLKSYYQLNYNLNILDSLNIMIKKPKMSIFILLYQRNKYKTLYNMLNAYIKIFKEV